MEFNVLSEVLEYVRNTFGKAYIVGYTTRQEAGHGLDASIDAPGLVISAYQFKAPSSGRRYTYRFRIGDRCWICSNPNLGSRTHPLREIVRFIQRLGLPKTCINQHTILYAVSTILETRMNIPVYYAFPLIRDYSELEQRVPGIVNYTVIMKVRNMPLRTLLDCSVHTVEIDSSNGMNNLVITISSRHSEKLPDDHYAVLGKELETLVKQRSQANINKSIHLEPDEILETLKKELVEKAEQEALGPEMIERARVLVEAILNISFSYRGITVVSREKTKGTSEQKVTRN